MLGFGRWCTVIGDVQLVVLASTVHFHMFLFSFFFFFFFWVTGEMFILYRQSTDRDTELT